MQRILIRGARQLLTLRGSSGPRRGAALRHLSAIEDGAVFIENGVIREVGPTRRLENLTSTLDAATIDARGCVVMPGFVDCHAHLVSGHHTDCRSRGHDAARVFSYAASVRSTPQAQLKIEASSVLRQASAQGTTTVGAIGGFGLDDSSEFKTLRAYNSLPDRPIRAVASYYSLNVLPPGASRASYVDHIIEVAFPAVERRRLAAFANIACGEGHFDTCSCRRFIESCSLNSRVRVDFAPDGPAEPLAPLLHPQVRSIEHLEFAAPADLQALAESDALAVLLPAKTFFLDTGRFHHGRPLVDAGAAIALGSDYNQATAPGCNMQFALWLACRRMNLTIAEAISAATINASHVLGLGHRIGSIEPGKQADILILQTPDHRALGHEFGGNLIGMTIKDGEIVHRAADFR